MTKIIVAVALVVCSSDHVDLCKVRVRTPNFERAQIAFAENAKKGTAILETNVVKLREDCNKHLDAIRQETKMFFDNALMTLTAAQKSFTDELVPKLLEIGNKTSELVENMNIAVQEVRNGLEVGIFLLLLLALCSVGYIRKRTGNDVTSNLGFLILSLIEVVILEIELFILVKFFHRLVTGTDPKTEHSVNLAIGIFTFIVCYYIMSILYRLFRKILSCAWYSLKKLIWLTVAVPFGWVLTDKRSIYLLLVMVSLTAVVVGTFLSFTNSLSNGLILSYLFLLLMGIIDKLCMYFMYLIHSNPFNGSEKLREKRLDYFTSDKPTLRKKRYQMSLQTQTASPRIHDHELLRKR